MQIPGSKWISGIALGAAVSAASMTTAQAVTSYVIGRCEIADSITVGTDTPGAMIRPTYDANSYIVNNQRNSPLKKYVSDKYSFYEAATKVLVAPKHGELIWDPNTGPNISAAKDGWYYYVSNKGFSGDDAFVIQVEKYGLKINVHYKIAVPEFNEDMYGRCDPAEWKISQIDVEGADGTDLASTTFTPDAPFLPTSPSAYLANVTFNLPNADIGVSNLAGAAVGQESTSGAATTITLDANAGGYGWFLDPTPADNSEFLPTSNPNEWIAKAGSAADGKMDMLSVLLHEYGHALGLDHSPDSHDFMAPTLQPGVRRLLSQADLQQIAHVLGAPAPLPGQPLPPLPYDLALLALAIRQRQSTDSATNGTALGAMAPVVPHYDVVTNPTLTNGDFNGTSGWTTSGDVTVSNGSAVLDESSNSQSRINQVFTVNASDRFLRFTVSGINLQNPGNGPQDAFEVALLDASTGQSLEAPIALSNTDDFLNLQGDGSSYMSSGVSFVTNADGSRTYLVDLAGIAANTAVNLSFDLIGFGDAGSHVTVSDVHVGLPQTYDDAVTSAEDTPVAIAALANDVAANQPGFVPVVVSGPAHGQVTVNADGTFGYSPSKDYFGADSFTYKLSNSQLDSNVSTVSITVTPVNDAPVANDFAQTTLEDASVAMDLLGHAHDVDSPVLTPKIVTGPAHGQLALNADGTYTYTPDANFNGSDSFSYSVNDGELDSNLATVQLSVTSVNDAPTPRWETPRTSWCHSRRRALSLSVVVGHKRSIEGS
jgi:VCBS repeat-containing protein